MRRYLRKLTEYKLSRSDILPAAIGVCALFMIGWLFYQHAIVAIVLTPIGLILVPLWNLMLRNRRNRLMQLEFSRFLQSLISTLYAGHSLESAFREIERDMRREAWMESNRMLPGIAKLNQRVTLGEPIEKVLLETVDEWELEDMKAFAETLSVFRKNGGNLLLHLRRTAELIIEKLQAEQDLQVILAKKQMEAVMMNIAPYFMIALVILGSAEYAKPLYSGSGRLVMSAALLLIAAGHTWSFWMLRRSKM